MTFSINSTAPASQNSNTSVHTAPSPSTQNAAPTAQNAYSRKCATYVLCAFRTTGSYCDGDHHVSALCQQFLTDKGCRYRKEDDHPFLGRSHDVELRRCMDVMLKPHQLGLYGVEHF
ncbi:hypothetical protein D6D18_04712 [Aureobasidium pullulans]|nr:hypothetical protein D6D18_04712 [Aureobasidium pullulans]